MGISKNHPGNANLPIGVQQTAILENGAPGSVWHSRGYLPHFESPEATQHVTFHLADSLPQTVLLRLESELKSLPAAKRDAERRKRVDAWIDAGHGSCVLRKPGIANMVQGSLLAFDSTRYRLLAWVVMPNHLHVLFEPMAGWTVAKIVASWKKFTARKICIAIPGTPISRLAAGKAPVIDPRDSGEAPHAPVWHREYWDRYIRDRRHFDQAVEYIHLNPVKAGLAAAAQSWPWSSAYSGKAGNANLPIGVFPDLRVAGSCRTRSIRVAGSRRTRSIRVAGSRRARSI